MSAVATKLKKDLLGWAKRKNMQTRYGVRRHGQRRAKTSHEKRLLLQIAKARSELAKTGTITPPLAPPELKKLRRSAK